MNELRPLKLEDYIGQEHVKRLLKVSIEAALKRGVPIDHVLLGGPAGIGKTTLAQIIANEMGSRFHIINGATVESVQEIESVLLGVQENDVVFIDEIHRLPRKVEEFLYHPLEDSMMSIRVPVKGDREVDTSNLSPDPATALMQVVRQLRKPAPTRMEFQKVKLPQVTFIGATTILGGLTKPLRDRFQLPLQLKSYTTDELAQMAVQKAVMLDTKIDRKAANALSERSRGVARILVNLIRRCRDYADALGVNKITLDVVNKTMSALQIDSKGLTTLDRAYLMALAESNGPKGADALASRLGEDRSTIAETIEPYLQEIGFVERTNRGRIITPQGREWILESATDAVQPG